jgi:DNA-binding LacI/PurR family transcriptional regulator
MKQFSIHFSAYTPMIEDQLREQGLRFITESNSKVFQRYADHVTNLRISGIITEGEADKAQKRIMKKLAKVIIER